MENDYTPETSTGTAHNAGAMLRDARLAAALELEEVSARTRIPQRHLAAIEAGDYAKLPSRTYAIGFSRTYARLVGLDERAVIEQVRLDLADGDPQAPQRPDRFEPGDPARVPSRRLAWLSLLAVVLLVVGAFSFYRSYFSPGLGPAPLTEPRPAATAPVAAAPGAARAPAAAVPAGPVVFTALEDGTWVKFYDGAGTRLFEAQMAKGDSFTIPADAQNPQVWTGRPYALAITVGGRPVPKLAEGDTIIRDVPVSAEALLARPAPAATPAAAPAANPAAAPTTAPAPTARPAA